LGDPRVTVVIPVYDRQEELRRALRSLTEQALTDFEAIVVDDASEVPIEPIVEEFDDPRFRYARNPSNSGPYNARVIGYRLMRGEYLFHLDSDWEAYPWALERAAFHLDTTPEVAGVAGLHLPNGTGPLFARVPGGRHIVTPEQSATNEVLYPDCVGVVRRAVVEEWLAKRTDYFALELHQWLTMSLNHNQLFVDEPWTRYHVQREDRLSTGWDERRVTDYEKFIEEHRRYIEETPSRVLDVVLLDALWVFRRAGRREDAAKVKRYLEARGVKPPSWPAAVAKRLLGRLPRRRRPAGPVLIR
jgi:hypothetical protein